MNHTTPTIPLCPDEFADDFDPSFGLSRRAVSPEKRLCLAVLLRTFADARGSVAGLESMKHGQRAAAVPAIQAEARAWLMGDTDVDAYSLSVVDVCDALGIDAAAIAARVAAGDIPNVEFLSCGLYGASIAQRRLWRGRRRNVA